MRCVPSLSGGSRGEYVPCLFLLLVAASIPWLVATSLPFWPLWSQHLLLICSQISLCISPRKTLTIVFRAHLGNLGLFPHLGSLNFITYAKIPLFAICSNIHKLQEFGHACLWGDHYSGCHTLFEKKWHMNTFLK